jgi:hypothetical protein
MFARQQLRREVLVFGIALLGSVALSRCGGHPTSNNGNPVPCHQGDPGCTCTVSASGTGTCTQGACPTTRVCGSLCCGGGEHCDKGTCIADAPQCIYVPGPNEFDPPEVVWWWPFQDAAGTVTRTVELPEFNQVMSTPAVIRLRGAAHPEDPPTVIFNTFHDGGTPNVEGVLRAVRGDDGTPLFTVTDPALRSNGVSTPAVADLDGDGNVEIVTGAFDPTPNGVYGGLMAFHHDGTLMWKAPGLFSGWGGPAIGDIDGDGRPEVVIGNTVLNGLTGEKLCDGGYTGIGDNNAGPLSVLTDIDNDGVLEILTGDMAYKLVQDKPGHFLCQHMWPDVLKDKQGKQLLQGFPAVAQIYNDPALPTTQGHPQIAVVSRGTVRVQDWTGGLIMDPITLPGGGYGGPPTIADFDGDGQVEIGVAASSHYTVFKPGSPNGILWTAESQDVSSSVTGSSVFDFLGNGTADVIYNDECYVHIYNGSNGNVLFEAPNSSCTAYEMPVIADVDGTGAAGLLVPSNNFCGIKCPYGDHHKVGIHGLRLFKSSVDSWVASRPVWNEHSFHLTNIGDNGEVPRQEQRFWGPNTLNAFRQNFQGKGTFAAPDLTVTKTWVDGTQCPLVVTMAAEIANIGSRGIRAGLKIAFYEETSQGRHLLGVSVLNQPLAIGQTAQVTLDWKGPPRLNPAKVIAVVDDDGTGVYAHKECNKNNNERALPEVICRDAG